LKKGAGFGGENLSKAVSVNIVKKKESGDLDWKKEKSDDGMAPS